jgi:L-seryl-tRNA(Ser) seleniumtransferase
MSADPATARPPSVDRILYWPAIAALCAEHGRAPVLDCVRAELLARRGQRLHASMQDDAALADAIAGRVALRMQSSLRRVFNLTGTVLHTNLGRAPLPPEAIEAMVLVASCSARARPVRGRRR